MPGHPCLAPLGPLLCGQFFWATMLGLHGSPAADFLIYWDLVVFNCFLPTVEIFICNFFFCKHTHIFSCALFLLPSTKKMHTFLLNNNVNMQNFKCHFCCCYVLSHYFRNNIMGKWC